MCFSLRYISKLLNYDCQHLQNELCKKWLERSNVFCFVVCLETAHVQVWSPSPSPIREFGLDGPTHIFLLTSTMSSLSTQKISQFTLKAVKDWIWVFKIFAKSQSMIYFNLERNWKVLILPKINSRHYLVSFRVWRRAKKSFIKENWKYNNTEMGISHRISISIALLPFI